MGTSRQVRRTYYLLTGGTTLAASLIWGINTIFLLDAGLSNFAAFAANAFFTAGMVLFEVPTGIVADSWGRRASFLLGTVTLAVTTALYVLLWWVHAPFGWWAVVSLLLGLGFTFFSGATEAWLVDALTATGFTGPLDKVFARGQVVTGVMMLTGSVAGGVIAQVTNLGVPFLVRAGVLLVVFVLALALMRDLGFTPDRSTGVLQHMRRTVELSVEYGLRQPPVRALMLAAPFTGGVGIFVFYALQPYLLDLIGDDQAYGIAGLVAAIVAGAQIVGGLVAPLVRRRFGRRTSAILLSQGVGAAALIGIGLVPSSGPTAFWLTLALIMVWALVAAVALPVRQALMNGMIPAQQRATILSFDSLVSSTGGIVAQPALGRAADVWSYQTSYLLSGIASAVALPFVARARQLAPPADTDVEATTPIPG